MTRAIAVCVVAGSLPGLAAEVPSSPRSKAAIERVRPRLRMERYRGSRWFEFWENLKEGYDLFENERRPPNVVVRAGRYAFERE